MTGQIDLSGNCSPVVIPEEELAVYPVPVGIEEGEEKLLVRAAKVARERGMDEAGSSSCGSLTQSVTTALSSWMNGT